MSQSGKFDALLVFQALDDTRVLRTNIPFYDVLDEPDLLDTIFQTMQLSDDFVSFVDQVRTNGLNEVELAKTVGISHLQDAVQLRRSRGTWLL